VGTVVASGIFGVLVLGKKEKRKENVS